MVPVLGGLVDLQEDIGKQSIYNRNLCPLQFNCKLLVPPKSLIFRPCTCACNCRGYSRCELHTGCRTGITCGGPGDPEGPLWLSCDLNILEGCV